MFSHNFSLKEQDFTLIHYKNCIFHGQIINSLKQNTALMLLDNGEVLIGNFKNDHLNGQCIIFLNPQTYVIGTFTRGLLDGNFVLRNSKMTIYWTVKMNKIQGQITVINYQNMLARTWVIQNGQGFCTNQIQIEQIDKQSQILSKISPYTQQFGSSLQFLIQKFNTSFNIQNLSLSQTTQISLKTNSFYKIKITIFKDKLVEYGVYNNDQLNGLGFSMEGGNILEGKFKSGKLDGYGLKIQPLQEKMIYGSFKNGDIRTIDIVTNEEDVSRKQLKNYKKQVHIHSLQFCNDYFNQRPILMLQNLLSTIELNEQNFSHQLKFQQDVSHKHQRTYQKTKQAWVVSSVNPLLSSLRKDKSTNQVNQQNIQTVPTGSNQKYQSRFKNTTLKKDQSVVNINTQFSQGIKQFNMINKALRKFNK